MTLLKIVLGMTWMGLMGAAFGYFPSRAAFDSGETVLGLVLLAGPALVGAFAGLAATCDRVGDLFDY